MLSWEDYEDDSQQQAPAVAARSCTCGEQSTSNRFRHRQPEPGSPDAGSPDAGSPDAGSPDAGARNFDRGCRTDP